MEKKSNKKTARMCRECRENVPWNASVRAPAAVDGTSFFFFYSNFIDAQSTAALSQSMKGIGSPFLIFF